MPSDDAESLAARNPDLVALVHASPDAMVVIRDGRHVFANDRALRLYRARDLAQLASKPALEYMAPSMGSVPKQRLESMTHERRQLGYVDETIVRLDGTRCEIEAAGSPIVFDGKPAALVVVRDITERKQAEQARHAAEERFRAAFVHAPIGMAVLDLTGVVAEANPALAELLRTPVDALLGTSMFDRVHPQDRQGSRGRFERLRSDTSVVETAEIRVVRGDGEIAWTQVSTTTLRDPAGAPSSFILQLHDVTDRHNAEEQLRHRASRDQLTDLANRTLFTERLELAIAGVDDSPRLPAVMFIDLDRFKIVNDSMGHICGDNLLAQVATRLHHSLRPTDLIARFGGDEFAVLLPAVRSADEAAGAARRLQQSLREPFVVDGSEIHVRASIGIALASSGSDAQTLLRDADSAMYRAKAAGGSGHSVFDASLRATTSRRMDLETGLYRVVADAELLLLYQPIVETTTGNYTGFEALLRWRRASGEIVSPAEFIPVAEETGTIIPIGAWVLRQATQQIRSWRAQHPDLPPLNIAVNVSSRQLVSPGFDDDVRASIDSLGPDTLTLEITESAAAQLNIDAVDRLEQLTRLGVQIAIDDFGTGQSSLARLQSLPVHTLKIDRQFIANLGVSEQGQELVHAILAMARALRLTATAEGVETPHQATLLREIHCPRAQGYLFGRPLPAEQVDFPEPTPPGRVPAPVAVDRPAAPTVFPAVSVGR